MCNGVANRAPLANLGFGDYRGKNWDFGIRPHLNLGLQKSGLNLGLQDFIWCNFGVQLNSKLGLWDYTPFEIGIPGLHRV